MATRPRRTPYRRPKPIAEQRRENIRRIDAMTVKVTKIYGRILVVNSGEASVFIPFPVEFCERPNFNYGGELDENHRPLAGSFPTISAVVIDWQRKGMIPETFDGYFTGATVAVVTTGQDTQHMWLHYSFEAKAFRNPVNTADTVDEAI